VWSGKLTQPSHCGFTYLIYAISCNCAITESVLKATCLVMVKFHSNPSYSQQYLELNSDTSGVSGKQHGKCKGKVVLCFFLTEHHAMKAYLGCGAIAPHVLDLVARWWCVVSFTHRPLYPRAKSFRYPFDRSVVGSPEPV